MRILFVATDADIGGAEVLLETLARHRRAGDRVSLAVIMKRGSLSNRLEDVMDSVDYLGFDAGSRNLRAMVKKLERVIALRAPDVISSHMFHADLVTALSDPSGAVRITTIHTERFGRGVHPLTRLIARAVGLLSRRFDGVVATSPGAVSFARRYRYAHKPFLIANAVGMPSRNSFQRNSRAFLSLARFHPVKGHDVLFRAFAQIAPRFPEWSLICAGPGVSADHTDLVSVIARANARPLMIKGRLQLRGTIDDLAAAMAESSALVISSVYGESAPIVGVEALSHGVPVITTRLGLTPLYADPRFVVAPGSVDDLARAMADYCLLDDDARFSLSEDARKRCATQFNIATTTADLEAVYQKAIDERTRTGRS